MTNGPVKILFVGLNTIDLQFLVTTFPKANTKTKAHRNEIAAGGPATNAAIACSALGSKSGLVTPVGQHTLAQFIKDDIIHYGVKHIDPLEGESNKPIFASIISDETNGERTIFSYHPEENKRLSEIKFKLSSFEGIELALFDGFYPEISIPLARECKNAGITTVLDGGSWKPRMKELIPYIDIAICSNDFSPPGIESKRDISEFLFNLGVKHVAVTRGEQSILVINKKNITEIDVPTIKAIDTLGAGDIFHGAFCHYYVNRPNFEEALLNASFIAAKSCTYHGTRNWITNLESIIN